VGGYYTGINYFVGPLLAFLNYRGYSYSRNFTKKGLDLTEVYKRKERYWEEFNGKEGNFKEGAF